MIEPEARKDFLKKIDGIVDIDMNVFEEFVNKSSQGSFSMEAFFDLTFQWGVSVWEEQKKAKKPMAEVSESEEEKPVSKVPEVEEKEPSEQRPETPESQYIDEMEKQPDYIVDLI